jgi:peptidoglycan/LPS O-acetylase OafA/YrhL
MLTLTPQIGFNDNYYFASLPIIRTFFTGGHFAVSVFFVISGYVLSAKPLSLIQSGEHSKLGDNLSSALFRRWLRLHIPVLVVTFLYMASWHALGIWTVSPEHKANFRDELWNFYVEFKNFSFVFRTGGEDWFTYNFPTWSIPVEFRGSIIIYTSLLAFSRCTRNARLLAELGLIFYFMYIVDGWFGSLFVAGTFSDLRSAIAPAWHICWLLHPNPFGTRFLTQIPGMLLCDLDLLARNEGLPKFLKRLQPFNKPIYYILFIIGLFLSGVPSHSSTYPLIVS